jgi:hypothetical protein
MIKRRAASAIVDAAPEVILRRLFAVGAGDSSSSNSPDAERERWRTEVSSILEVFGNSYMNKHLMYAIVELIVIRAFPEMAEKGVEALLAERLG